MTEPVSVTVPAPASVPVSVIDPDVRRRAAIAFFLSTHGFVAEPYEAIEEFVQRLPRAGVALIHDGDCAVASLMNEVAKRNAWLPVVAYSQAPEPPRVVAAVLDGAVGYASWPDGAEALIKAIRSAARRLESVRSGARRTLALSRLEALSQRERAILAGMIKGLSNRMIASHLSISPRTVELHRANLLSKIGARHSAEAIRLGIEAELPAFGNDAAGA